MDLYVLTYAVALLVALVWAVVSIMNIEKLLFDLSWPRTIAWVAAGIVPLSIAIAAAVHVIRATL